MYYSSRTRTTAKSTRSGGEHVDVPLTIAVVGLASNVAVATVAILALRSQRGQAKTDARKAEALEDLARSQQVVVASHERQLKDIQKELASLETRLGSSVSMAHVRMAELEEKKRRAEYAKQKDIAKVLGWLLQNSDED